MLSRAASCRASRSTSCAELAGVIVLPTKDPSAAVVNFSVLSSTGKESTSGFDDLSFAGQGRVRTDFFGLTGHQLFGAAY